MFAWIRLFISFRFRNRQDYSRSRLLLCRRSLLVRWSSAGSSTRESCLAAAFSAGSVVFARGLNDTPKIVALLLVIKTFDVKFGMLLVAAAMAIGGLLNARRVAITMSKKITPLNPGQGFTANLVTSSLVILASRFGLPVSTTHVSVGSLFGIGLITREANRRVVSGILMSWVLTLPIAAILSAVIYAIVSRG